VPHNRYYVDTYFQEGKSVTVSGDEWRHLTKVSRSKPGDVVELINGKSALAVASVVELERNQARLVVDAVEEQTPPPPLILAQAIPRMNHLEWIVEKATELGATALWLFPGNLSEKNTLSPHQQERLKNLCIAAMKQCGRFDLPDIVFKPPLQEWQPQGGTFLFGDTSEAAPYLWEVTTAINSPLIMCIGPEKGFDAKEVEFMTLNLKAKGVRLHPNILRAETAPLVALSLIQVLKK
jgi:16S rRNA (uracil1498-N3)-methyltransferase